MGRPAKGFLQKQVTEFQESSSFSSTAAMSSSSVSSVVAAPPWYSGDEEGAGDFLFLKPFVLLGSSLDDAGAGFGGGGGPSQPLPDELPVEPSGELL